ncbi:hypothetical protein TNCV_4313101 [Trichonephila clavipes]|nr:hypothetical protein TNCV_4313101 [Trichonephila clavipes]
MASGGKAADVADVPLVRSAGASVACTKGSPQSAPHSENGRRFWMAKVLSDRIGNPTPVWTINPLVTSRQDNVNPGVNTFPIDHICQNYGGENLLHFPSQPP